MKIKPSDVIDFVLKFGDAYDITFKSIEAVGIPRVCADASRQMNARTLEAHTSAEAALHDYFGDGAFDNLFDVLWREGTIRG